MTIKFANNISTTLALGAGIAATSFDVVSTTGFPVLGSGDYFYGTLANTLGAVEIVQVTGWTGTTVTCVRGAEGTPPQAWSTGDAFEIRVTAAGLTTVLNATEVVEEVQTATSGQTVFTLTTFMYVPGENTLSVYVDGVNQIVDLSYTETGATTVTFISGLHLGALVKFTTLRTSGLTTSAAVVTYEPAGTGAVATTVQAKLRESVSVLDFGADPTGVADSTPAITAALAASDSVYVPAGIYTTSAVIEIDNFQVLFGDGSEVSVIRNNTTDGIRMKPNAKSNGNYFQIKGIGFTKTFDSASTTVAFNLENTSFIKCEDIAATNFYKGLYLARNPGSAECWYNAFHRVTFQECFYGVHIDDSISSQSVNGCMFNQMMITNWDYLWITAGVTPSTGIRYSGYGHVFKDSYVQGCTHHIWRDLVGGGNILSGLYLESAVVPGEVVYCPLRYFANQDIFIPGHGDGFDLGTNFYDPQGNFNINYGANSPVVTGGTFRDASDLILNGSFSSSTTNWVADQVTLASVAGGVSGNCLQITQSGAPTGYAYQTIYTDAGKRYKITLSHKNGSFTGRLLVGSTQSNGDYVAAIVLNDVAWTQYSYYFTPTTTTTYVSLVCAGSSQTTLFDSVSIAQVSIGASGDISITGIVEASNAQLTLSVYANNAAALVNGLKVGQFYRTGADPDHVCVVH